MSRIGSGHPEELSTDDQYLVIAIIVLLHVGRQVPPDSQQRFRGLLGDHGHAYLSMAADAELRGQALQLILLDHPYLRNTYEQALPAITASLRDSPGECAVEKVAQMLRPYKQA